MKLVGWEQGLSVRVPVETSFDVARKIEASAAPVTSILVSAFTVLDAASYTVMYSLAPLVELPDLSKSSQTIWKLAVTGEPRSESCSSNRKVHARLFIMLILPALLLSVHPFFCLYAESKAVGVQGVEGSSVMTRSNDRPFCVPTPL